MAPAFFASAPRQRDHFAVLVDRPRATYRLPLVIEGATYGSAMLIVLAGTLVSAALVRRRLDRLDLIAVLKTRE